MLVSDEFCFSSWFNCNTCWCKLNECLEMNRLSHFSQANLRKGWTIYWWIFRSDSLVNFSSQSLQSIVLLSDFACINFICVFKYLMQLNSFEHSTQLTLVRVISCVSINYCLKKMICRIGHIEGLLSFREHLLLWILNLPLAENGFWHWPHTWSFYLWWPRRFNQRPPDSPFRVSEQILTSVTTSKNSSLYDFLVPQFTPDGLGGRPYMA